MFQSVVISSLIYFRLNSGTLEFMKKAIPDFIVKLTKNFYSPATMNEFQNELTLKKGRKVSSSNRTSGRSLSSTMSSVSALLILDPARFNFN